MDKLKSSMILLLTATIWGVAFVAQSTGMEYVGGFTFNCVRFLIGGIVLIPCIFLLRKSNVHEKGSKRTLIVGGISCGTVLCIASNLQQHGIKYTTVGKAGFITALYIVLVPVLGLFLHKKVGKLIWLGLILAVTGLYLLCINEQFTVGIGDLLVLACAAVFAVHILVIDHFAPLVDCVTMSCIQFFTCGVLSAIPMFLFENVSPANILTAAGPILYAGVLSCGVAYTLQIIGQRNMNPTVASMILSLESVISVLAGLLILHQKLSGRELMGCVLMFVAVILSQLPQKEEHKEKE